MRYRFWHSLQIPEVGCGPITLTYHTRTAEVVAVPKSQTEKFALQPSYSEWVPSVLRRLSECGQVGDLTGSLGSWLGNVLVVIRERGPLADRKWMLA